MQCYKGGNNDSLILLEKKMEVWFPILCGVFFGWIFFGTTDQELEAAFAKGYEARQMVEESSEPEKAEKICVDFQKSSFNETCFEALQK